MTFVNQTQKTNGMVFILKKMMKFGLVKYGGKIF